MLPMTNTPFLQKYSQLPASFYERTLPEALLEPTLIHYNQDVMTQLGLELSQQTIEDMTSGNHFPDGLQPLAQKYTGHQFGYYNPDLGDGRGVLLGQTLDNKGGYWDLHLKGSGRTAFSRRGDGRAVLRSAIREYLIGEALHALDVPTTRCLSICTSSEAVRREQLEPRATYIRVAKTHIRFGHFEWLAQKGNIEQQKQLAEYVIETVYPELSNIVNQQERYAKLLTTIMEKTGVLIAAWQTVGFCHGVMNTDNMSVAGETFDFGPYAFLDDCKIHYICNHSDTEGRYAYSQQPNIGLWNCQVLGQAFANLVEQKDIENAVNSYVNTFNQQYLLKMGYKFGFTSPQQEDKHFIADTLILMDQSNLDFHYFFTLLKQFDQKQHDKFEAFIPHSKEWDIWQDNYRQRIKGQSNTQQQNIMQKAIPDIILRNYIAQEIIDAAMHNNFKPLADWIQWLSAPMNIHSDTSTEMDLSYLTPPDKRNKGLALSCSS